MFRIVSAAAMAAALLAGCQSIDVVVEDKPPQSLPAGWSIEVLPGARSGVELRALKRSAVVEPVRYRVSVVPGSGCTGWLPLVERYFAGLLHAEVLVLHKPHVDLAAGAGADCSPEFTQTDALSAWRDHARAALRANEKRLQSQVQLPQLLVGISEGAELLPDLAPELSSLAGVVMISASGLDPREAGELQARRLGQLHAWRALESAQSSDDSDDAVVEGRTLKYWRDLWKWQLTQPLVDDPWPLLRVWGDADELVPAAAYRKFNEKAHSRSARYCDVLIHGANHGLQGAYRDGVQRTWAYLEGWARRPALGFCTTTANQDLTAE